MVDGKKVITGTSVAVHSITKDGKYGVAKAVSIIKIGNKKNDTEVTLKKGKTAQITAIEIKKDKKIKHHRNLCYESSDRGEKGNERQVVCRYPWKMDSFFRFPRAYGA